MGRSKKTDNTTSLLEMISKGVGDIGFISDMEDVLYYPTLLTSYNRATGIGGHPKGRIVVIHGPPQVGKSVLALSLAESARLRGDVPVVFDAEFASEKEWYNAITPNTLIKYPEDFDDLVQDIQTMLNNLDRGKKAKKKSERIDSEVGCFFVVDTLVKLLPKDILSKIEKDGIEQLYPIQALRISVWMKSIVKQIYKSNSTLVLVLQERKKVNAKPFEKDYKLPLGEAIQYDNCVRIRVRTPTKIKSSDKIVIGLQSPYTVENNKVDGTALEKGLFFTSNGKGNILKGLDLVREAIEEGRYREVVKKNNSFVSCSVGNFDLELDGGWADLREYFTENEMELKKFVNALNKEARR